MSKTSFTIKEVLSEIASTIRTEIAAHETSIEAMRKKELERSHGKLNKSELCILCADPEFNCKCPKILNKSEKLAKKTPPDVSEKTMHKLKDEYGHDKKGKEKAFATAWSIENKMKKEEMSTDYASDVGVSFKDKGKVKAAYGDGPHDQRPAMHMGAYGQMNPRIKDNTPKVSPTRKDEMDGGGDQSMMMSELCLKCGKKNSLCKCMGKKEVHLDKKEVHLDKAAMASSSASALAPKPEPTTPVAHVNKEMGGFKSLASKGPSVSSMGRAKASASGSFNTIKAEMGTGKQENFSEEANGGATKTMSTPGVSTDKAKGKQKAPGKLPVPKAENFSEEANGNVTKMELKTKPDTDIPDKGSGGETRKGPSLKKSAVPSVKKPEVVGTAGKQPVGLGGGDANKLTNSPHPDTKAALADVKGLSPTNQWKGQGLPQLQNKLATTIRGGSGWLQKTHASAVRVHPNQAAPKSQRFHGAMPLQRGEKEPSKEPSINDQAVGHYDQAKKKATKAAKDKATAERFLKPSPAKKAEMPAPTEGLSSINHNRNMLKVKA